MKIYTKKTYFNGKEIRWKMVNLYAVKSLVYIFTLHLHFLLELIFMYKKKNHSKLTTTAID